MHNKKPIDRKVIEKRNSRIKKLFDYLGLEVQIVGNINTPAVIYDKILLSCYAHNFNLVFTTKSKEGEELFRIKLFDDISAIMQENPNFAKKFTYWMQNSEGRRVYSIKVSGLNLFLSGYNFLDRTNMREPKGRYPVFAPYNPEIYYDTEKPLEIISDYEYLGLNLELF